jgi:hypothetical protein
MQPFDCRDRSRHTVPTWPHGSASVCGHGRARASVLAALNDLVEEGLATWHRAGPEQVELHCSSGEAWLLDGAGVTRLR